MPASIVLGAGGFIGSSLLRVLASRGGDLTAVDLARPLAQEPAPVTWLAKDLFRMSGEDLADLLPEAGTVFHLAWSSFPAGAELDPGGDLQANVGFSIRLFTAASKRNARVIFLSSGGAVYGEAQTPLIREDHPCRPIGAYGACKLAAEGYAGAFRRARGLDVRIARLSNPFGVGQAAARNQGAVTRFARCALNGEPIEIWGDGGVVRDYLHVDDAVRGVIRLAETERSALGPDPIFNVGAGEGASLRQIIALLDELTGKKTPVLFSPARQIDVRRNVLDTSRAREFLGWAPRFNLRVGLETLLADLAD